MMASLSGTGKKEITPNFITHHVSYALMQQILSAYWAKPEIFDLTTDLFVLSFQPDYKKMSLYRNILKPAGFSDLMLQFVKAPDSEKYLSCILYLSKERSFHADEIDWAKAVTASIAYAHMENIYLWDMRSRVNILIDNMDHYPLGISTNTVKTHLSNVYKKLGISYRTELMNLLYKMDEESRLK